MKYNWIKINIDEVKVNSFVASMKKWISTCPVDYVLNTLEGLKSGRSENMFKKSEIFYLKDEEHEAFISIIYTNGMDRWKIGHMVFEGELNDNIYRKFQDIIYSFMEEKKVDRVWALVPDKISPDKMRKFFDGVKDWWKIDKDLTFPYKGTEMWWILKDNIINK